MNFTPNVKICENQSNYLFLLISFNIPVPDDIRKAASFKGVMIKEFNVVYALIDDLKDELSNKLPIKDVENHIGTGTVSQEFLIKDKIKKEVPVAGCKITSGDFNISKKFKVTRGPENIYDGNISSLKHFKEEKNIISHGKDCGLILEDLSVRFQTGDVITCYEIHKEKQRVNWSTGF